MSERIHDQERKRKRDTKIIKERLQRWINKRRRRDEKKDCVKVPAARQAKRGPEPNTIKQKKQKNKKQ